MAHNPNRLCWVFIRANCRYRRQCGVFSLGLGEDGGWLTEVERDVSDSFGWRVARYGTVGKGDIFPDRREVGLMVAKKVGLRVVDRRADNAPHALAIDHHHIGQTSLLFGRKVGCEGW